MSLINEALKKAQHMRHPSAQTGPAEGPAQHQAPPPPPPPPSPPLPPPSGYSGRSVLLLAGSAALLTCICILATVWILRPGSTATGPALAQQDSPVLETPAKSPALTAAADTSSPAAETPAPPIQAPLPPKTSQPQPALVVAPPPPRAADKPLVSLPPIQTPGSATTSAQTPPPETKASAPEETASKGPTPLFSLPAMVEAAPQVQDTGAVEAQWVAQTRIAGIRPGIKVLLNGRAYRPNDVVEPILGIRLAQIAMDHLIFVDRQGRQHRRNF